MQPTYAHTMYCTYTIHGHTRYALVQYHCGQEYRASNNGVASAKALIKEHVATTIDDLVVRNFSKSESASS